MSVAKGIEGAFALAMTLPLLFFAGCVLYLVRLMLAAVSLRGQVAVLEPPTGEPAARTNAQDESANGRKRFVLLIPAHNEELVLGAALDSLNALDYPKSAYRIVVIADNCTDSTAQIARSKDCLTLERADTIKIGKGYALEWALESLLHPNGAQATLTDAADFDAVVILDADTKVSSNLLAAFATGLNAGHRAMQARYEVLNVGDSWRTRLMACALALAHIVKPLGRERLKLSDGLKGNGMCFAREVVEAVPWSGSSITEDIEYTLRLCRAGERIAFLPNAAVWAQMPTTGTQAASQRKRWEGGRYQLLFKVAPAALREGLKKRNRILIDRAIELIVPPFAEMFALPLVLLAVCAAVTFATGWQSAWRLTAAWAAVLVLQFVYLIGGLWVGRVPLSVALSLLKAPVYIGWKLGVYVVMAVSRSAGGWKRTERREL